MTRRYFHPDLPTTGGNVTLCESESQHAARVMRVKVGDEIEIFNGVGGQAKAIVTEINRRDCHCRSEPMLMVDRESDIELHLGIALPKPDRAKELIERLTEMGVKSVTPIVAARTQRPPSTSLLEKLRRGVIEACKQSQRNVLMSVYDPLNLDSFLERFEKEPIKLIAHPDGESLPNCSSSFGNGGVVLIGPEGGWNEAEVEVATESGFRRVGLGKRIFRIETASVVIAARLLN